LGNRFALLIDGILCGVVTMESIHVCF